MKGRRDFASQDLTRLDLQKVDLSGGIFHQAKLAKQIFRELIYRMLILGGQV
jgi:uncharacterized protein YjbI with pentapeptide repeats